MGLSTRGREVIRAYQIGGQSISGDPRDWRRFHFDEIQGVRETPVQFHVRPSYHPRDKSIREVDTSVVDVAAPPAAPVGVAP